VNEFDAQRRRLAEQLEKRGAWSGDAAWLAAATEALPRHAFAPERLWRWDGHAYVPVDRDREPDAWAAEVYGDPDAAAITQVGGGLPTSSLSCEGVVVDMLDALRLEPGHRVLELGSGTGRNAALLAHRVGPGGRVTSVEVDPGLATEARSRLVGVTGGAPVSVRVGDGAEGWPGEAPYDRVIATYAVDRVPWAWVAQTRPGGRIVTPWGRLGHIALTVAADGRSATGWVRGLAQFMPARGTPAAPDFAHVRGTGPAKDVRPFPRDLAPLRDDAHLRFALRVALPDVRVAVATDEDGVNAWLHDGAASWAMLAATSSGPLAHQGGPRHLATALDAAWGAWDAEGSPRLWDFGLTVRADGEQYAWARDPGTGPRWPLPGNRPVADSVLGGEAGCGYGRDGGCDGMSRSAT
jgi:protein-L-isoaspartate O-methyltransferase